MTTSTSSSLSSTLPAELQNNPLTTFGRGIAAYTEVKPEHIAPAIEYLLKQSQDAVDVAVNPSTPSTWDALAEPLEDATELTQLVAKNQLLQVQLKNLWDSNTGFYSV